MNAAPTNKVMTSTFLWIVALFVVANLAWGLLRPLQAVPHTAQPNLELSKAALRYKMDKLTKAKTADFMIIGSSLPMCAFFYTERPPFFDLKEGERIRNLKLNLLQSYPEAGYFQNKLKELSKTDYTVFNFAGAACMVSDSKLVIERAIAANRAPKTLIYGLGLRDFVDNVNPPPGETPYYKALCNAQYVLGHLTELAHFPSFSDLSVAALCKLYDLRNEFRISAEHVACKTFHHPSSIELAFILGDLNKKMAAPPPPVLSPAPLKRSDMATDSISSKNGDSAADPISSKKSDAAADAISPKKGESAANSISSKNGDFAASLGAPASSRQAEETATKAHSKKEIAAIVKGSDNAELRSATNVPTSANESTSATNETTLAASKTTSAANKPISAAMPEAPLATLDYSQRYTPANYKRLHSEMEQLREVIALCKKQNIRLILINMPVSEGHKTLSPPGLREEYLRELRQTAPTASLFIDCENMHLPNSSFFDTVHLNGTGSVQFVDFLSQKLSEAGFLN